jgi:two-component system chemotaxis response regulator CheY
MQILILDDGAAIRRIVHGLLEELGFQNIREAKNEHAVIQELKQRKPDLLICDGNMIWTAGLDRVRANRSESELEDIAVLMISDGASGANFAEAVKAGVSNYIVKPFTAENVEEN